MAKGEKNLYQCEVCNQAIVTIDSDDGTTPMMIRCKATAYCQGMMQSSWYRNVPPNQQPTYEWRKPTKKECRKSSPDMRDHYDMGGLNIYRIKRG